MRPKLTAAHHMVHDGIFRHAMARNLEWRDVLSMLGGLAVGVLQAKKTA